MSDRSDSFDGRDDGATAKTMDLEGPTVPLEAFRTPPRIPPTSTTSWLLQVNELVGERYRVVDRLGSGGMGEVYVVADTWLRRHVALKIMRLSDGMSEEALHHLTTEAQVTASLDHPGIVKTHDIGEYKQRPYLVMEYVRGQDLGRWLGGQRLDPSWVTFVGQGVAAALAVAHRNGILHRDLKPANVMVAEDGSVRVLDFGIAAGIPRIEPLLGGPWNQTRSGDVIVLEPAADGGDMVPGTPAYMAREQWAGEPLTGAVDVWALGVILWELLEARRLFTGGQYEIGTRVLSRVEIKPLGDHVPRPLARMVMSCLEYEPERRPTLLLLGQMLRDIAVTFPQAAANPLVAFPGLVPFHEGMADRFFGREDEIERFVNRLESEQVLPVVGPSACGKTSFVRAGVIPQLHQLGRWVVLDLEVSADPWWTLAAEIRAASRTEDVEDGEPGHAKPFSAAELEERHLIPIRALAADLRADPSRLGNELRGIAQSRDVRVLLFVDQLERVYWNPDQVDAKAFVDTLLATREDACQEVRVILSLRDDLAWQLAEAGRVPWDEFGLEVLPRLDGERIEEIMRRSVGSAEFSFADPALVEDLVREIDGCRGVLPALQIAGRALWERRSPDSRAITWESYKEMGGVLGALARHAEAVVGPMPDDARREAQVVLTRLGQAGRVGLAREVLLDERPPSASQVLGDLIDARVVVVGRGSSSRSERYQLVHADLPSSWPRLRRWLAEPAP